jgi:hypothetical protein
MTRYNGYLSLEVNDTALSMKEIANLAEKLGGYVASSRMSNVGSRATGYMTIRIPRNRFHEGVLKFSMLGKVLDQRTSSDDVTERYIDLKARLENLQRQENRLRELLAKATAVTEILAVEKELERVRGQIESLQGQVNYLERSVEMSSITIQLTRMIPWFTPPGIDWGETLETAIRALFVLTRGLVISIIAIGPFVVPGAIAVAVYKRLKRKRTLTLSRRGVSSFLRRSDHIRFAAEH